MILWLIKRSITMLLMNLIFINSVFESSRESWIFFLFEKNWSISDHFHVVEAFVCPHDRYKAPLTSLYIVLVSPGTLIGWSLCARLFSSRSREYFSSHNNIHCLPNIKLSKGGGVRNSTGDLRCDHDFKNIRYTCVKQYCFYR